MYDLAAHHREGGGKINRRVSNMNRERLNAEGFNVSRREVLTASGATLIGATMFGSLFSFPVDAQKMDGMKMKSGEHALRNAMRKLWEDHITWTRLFIVSEAADLPDKAATTERLLRNQVDIGNAIKPYYGDPAGNKLADLLKDHIMIAA